MRGSARLLADQVGLYTYISSISVFDRVNISGIDENGPLGTLKDETVEEITNQTYGPLKALCEREIDQAMRGRALHIRSGLVVGPYDHSDRLLYWVYRVSQGGEVLVPRKPATQIQFIDARDLGRWTVQTTEAGLTGPYISTSPAEPLTMGNFLKICRDTTSSAAVFTWVGDQLLAENRLREEKEIPWWLPEGDYGYGTYNTQKALNASLRFRPLAGTIQDTLAWHDTSPADHEWQSGLRPYKEKELLATWHKKQ